MLQATGPWTASRGLARRSAVVAAALVAACGRDVSSRGGEAAGGSGSESESVRAAAPTGAASQAVAPAPDRRPALVFLGDSLTAGFGLSAAEAVPAIIQQEVDRAGLGLRVINAGRSGDTTAGGRSRVDFYLRPEVAPRALVIWLGANDIMRGLATAEIEANLRAIVRRGRQFDGALRVFLVQMRAFPNLGAAYAHEFEAIYPRVARSEGATLIPFPMNDVAGRPELNQPDGIHPTAEGTRKVAEALWSALAPHLARP